MEKKSLRTYVLRGAHRDGTCRGINLDPELDPTTKEARVHDWRSSPLATAQAQWL